MVINNFQINYSTQILRCPTGGMPFAVNVVGWLELLYNLRIESLSNDGGLFCVLNTLLSENSSSVVFNKFVFVVGAVCWAAVLGCSSVAVGVVNTASQPLSLVDVFVEINSPNISAFTFELGWADGAFDVFVLGMS